MTSPKFEAFLAQLYVDVGFRASFLADPRGLGARAGLSEAECEALGKIDREGLRMAAASFAAKRKPSRKTAPMMRPVQRLISALRDRL